MFDDSYIHGVINKAPTERVVSYYSLLLLLQFIYELMKVLLVDVWHPDLTPPEIEAFKLLLPK